MRPPRPWTVVQHVPFEGPGLIAPLAAAHGIDLNCRRMDRGASLPALEEIGGLVVMGGPMGVSDAADHPHLADELRLLEEAASRQVPVLGVCLGAQLLAHALGAPVFAGSELEIGAGSVTLTADGMRDPVLGATGRQELPVFHWHRDTFELPAGAVRLAASDRYPNQAFCWGTRVYGLQFHLEVDRGLATDWAPKLPPGVTLGKRARSSIELAGRRVLDAFFAGALAC